MQCTSSQYLSTYCCDNTCTYKWWLYLLVQQQTWASTPLLNTYQDHHSLKTIPILGTPRSFCDWFFFIKNVVGNVLKKMLVYRHLILWQEIVLWMQVVNHSLTLFGTACCRFILDCDFFVCYVIKIIKIFNDSLQELNFVLQMYLCEHWSMQDVCVFLPYWTNWLIKSQVYYFLYTCFIF